jgi:hypothetical protein
VVGSSIKAEIGMGRFTVYSMAQRTIGPPVNIYVKEGEVALTFGLHGELNVLVAISSSKMSVCTRSTWHHIPEDGIPHSHRCVCIYCNVYHPTCHNIYIVHTVMV